MAPRPQIIIATAFYLLRDGLNRQVDPHLVADEEATGWRTWKVTSECILSIV